MNFRIPKTLLARVIFSVFQGAPKIAYKFAYENSDILNKTATTMASKEEVENLDKKLKACVKFMILNPNALIPQAMRAIFFTIKESQNPKYQMKVRRLLQLTQDKQVHKQVPAVVSTNGSAGVSSLSTPPSNSPSSAELTPAPAPAEELSPQKKSDAVQNKLSVIN